MRLKIFVISLVSLFLVACEPVNNYPWRHFDDKITKYQETDKCGLAFGYRAIYVYYGEMKGSNGSYRAGTASNMVEIFNYPILEILKLYPELRNEKSVRDAAIQYQYLLHKVPVFTDPAEFGQQGYHG